jgi:hypothetical protein
MRLIVSIGTGLQETPLFQKAFIRNYLGYKPLVFNILSFIADSVFPHFCFTVKLD